MPRYSGTGPLGEGPMTGRGFGPCGRGFRRGYGRCFGFGNIPKEDEKKLIEEEKKYLEQRLKELNE